MSSLIKQHLELHYKKQAEDVFAKCMHSHMVIFQLFSKKNFSVVSKRLIKQKEKLKKRSEIKTKKSAQKHQKKQNQMEELESEGKL